MSRVFLSPLQTSRGKGKETVLTHMDISPPQQTCPQICFPSIKLKQAKKYFSSNVCFLFILCCYLCACRKVQYSWAPGPAALASAAFQTSEDGTRAGPPLQLAGTALFQGWGEQAESWEHKEGFPVGLGLVPGWGIPHQLCSQQILKELKP